MKQTLPSDELQRYTLFSHFFGNGENIAPVFFIRLFTISYKSNTKDQTQSHLAKPIEG
jgi:hypothetical protein